MIVAGSLPMTLLTTASKSILQNAIPKTSLLLLAASSRAGTAPTPSSSTSKRIGTSTSITSSTALNQQRDNSMEEVNNNNNKGNSDTKMFPLSSRAKSCAYMAMAMALHFGGYEFARSGALALFTSSEFGFSHPSAHPFAMGIVTPISLSLLYWYGLILEDSGPRQALKKTTMASIAILSVCAGVLKLLEVSSITTTTSISLWISKALVAVLFVFQNSYAHLLYTQHWSFLGSVMTPSEGTKWFSAIAGLSSLVCTLTATLVHHLAPIVGLLGLIFGTSLTLAASLIIADQAYDLSEKNGFDPTPAMKRKYSDKNKKKGNQNESSELSLLSKTAHLFRRIPTLAALFCEVILFQSLSTVLNICFVRKLKESMPLDTDRASFTGRFYAYINGSSCLMQFFVLPLARKYVEPRWSYRLMPFLLVPCLVYSAIQSASSLWVTAAAFFSLKTLDYSLRNVVNEMVYQPLDFDSRYLGKEVIGVFANRFGKSGMSIILSLITAQFPGLGVLQLSQLSLGVASMWTLCSFWLSNTVISNQEAEQRVKERQSKEK